MSRERTILILTRDSQRATAWRKTLAGAGLRPLSAANLCSPLAQPDIAASEIELVLTDDPHDTHDVPLPPQRLERGEIGVVAVGSDGPADVLLPADVTPRELLLACRLLGQIVALRRQLNSEQRQQRHLRQAAATDSLTGLANRRTWDEMLHRLEHHPPKPPAEANVATVIALLDIDGFKRWNDEFGHVLADQQLISVAERLTAAVAHGDFVFRWGGDEFVLLLSNVPDKQAGNVVERIRRAAGLQAPRSLTLSAGWAVLRSEQSMSPAAVFRAADEELRRAKLAGGDCSSPGN